jgi:cytochrome P450
LWEIKQKYCLGERERNVRKCKQVLDEFAYKIIRETKEHHVDNPMYSEQREDIISRFLQYYSHNQHEQLPTDKELRDFVMTFVMAGRDTTAVALSWTLWELTRHPAVIDAIRDEVQRVFAQRTDAEDFTYEMVNKLSYTHAVVMEAFRLHSPAPESFRFSVHDDTLPDGTFIPGGSLIMYSPYSVCHSDKVWGNDAHIFDPNRFFQNPVEPSPFKFPVFNGGPRTRPGKSLALMELKMALAYLVTRFDFEDATSHDGDYKWTIVMATKEGFPVKATKRS